VTSPNLFTNSATATSYTVAGANPEGATQTEGQALYQQASSSHQPEVVVKRQFEQRNQDQKTKLANDFIGTAGREGINHLASTPDGQHALAVVYDHAGGEGRGLMREVHEEQGNTAVDYTHRDAVRDSSSGADDMPTGTTHTEENATISDAKEWERSEKTLNGYHIYLNAPAQYKRQVECLNGCHSTGFNVDEKQYVTSVGDVFGADLAVNATEYYANKQIETGNPLYAVPGSASALMLPENQDKTELVLSLGASLPSVIKGGASLISAMRRTGAHDVDEVAMMRTGFDDPGNEFRVLGAAVEPRFTPLKNADGIIRSPDEAIELAESYGVNIPHDDVQVVFMKSWRRQDSDAEYFDVGNGFYTGAEKIGWDDFVMKHGPYKNKLVVRVSEGILDSARP
jgi:hypothetical protein